MHSVLCIKFSVKSEYCQSSHEFEESGLRVALGTSEFVMKFCTHNDTECGSHNEVSND